MENIVDFEKPINLECNIYNACRTNTGRARTNDWHYDFNTLVEISGARFTNTLNDLQWCAENGKDEAAIESIRRLAQALLSAYQIQSDSYKRYPNEK